MTRKLELTPNQEIERKTRGEIEAYIAGRGKTRLHEGARNLSLSISDDYGNRFLVELIQNAHDAHPPETADGEIAIVLAPDEGPHGCLYVANQGRGFEQKNFESITNIALSSKPVNEDIGNKGLGFRSVWQICEWPEIYSAIGSNTALGFDGYCFRFATKADVARIASEMGSPSLANEIWELMPSWFLPVVATDRPGLVESLSERGFVTVVRMPLESKEAKAAAIQQIKWLLALQTPLHLFLNRIARISIEIQPDSVQVLERKRLDTWRRSSGAEIQCLRIGGDKFLLAGTDLNAEEFRRALDESLIKRQVPIRWSDWQGPARVSIAIRLDHSVDRGLLYCFVPLGDEGAAPFAGYINANFYTKIDRRSVDGGIALNRFFISSAAKLCKETIDFLIEQNWPSSPGAVADLLCWNATYAGDVRNAFKSSDLNIVTAPILPTWNKVGVKWQDAASTFIWAVPDTSCLSVAAIAKASETAILLPTLSDRQTRAIREFFRPIDQHFDPSSETIAHWVESVAQAMIQAQATPETWAVFYDEVATHLRSDPSVLFGKHFLLSAAGTLIDSRPTGEHRGRRRAADIYFPPVRTGDADEDADGLPLETLPASLKRRFAFLSRDVPWINDDGGYRPARAFFLEAKLVREYDTREALRTLAGITRSAVADRTKETALEWAFRLWSSGRSLSEKETRGAHFTLPTISGWRSSEDTMFGSGWTTSNGKVLEKLLKSGGEQSAELATARDCLLVPYRDWPIPFGIEDDWHRFLRAAGARDCLRPTGVDKRVQKDAYGYLMGTTICNSIQLDEEILLMWKSELSRRSSEIRNPNTIYRSELNAWTLPGLAASLNFVDSGLRRDYAYQVLQAIPHLQREHLSFRVYRPGRFGPSSNEERWPTPLMVFLTNALWLPVQRAGTDVRFVAPSSAWLSSLETDPRPPRFVDLVSSSVARRSDEGLTWLRANAGLGLLDDPKDAARALDVYSQVAGKKLTEDGDVRRFSELFSTAFNTVVQEKASVELNYIPVRVGDRIEAVSLHVPGEETQTSGVAYFSDEDNDVKTQLLTELQEPIFDFIIADIEQSWELIEKLAPGRFRRISKQPLEVRINGARFEPSLQDPLLRDVFGAWITDFFICTAEHKGGSFFTRTQKSLSKLRHAADGLRFVLAQKIEISMSGRIKDLPSAAHGAVVLRHGGITTLLVEAADYQANLDLLARVAEQLAIALNQKPLANGFEAAFLQLAKLQPDESDPSDEDVAEALGVNVNDLKQTRSYSQLDLSSHVIFARPLAAYFGLSESVALLEKLADEAEFSEERVLEALQPVAIAANITEQELVARLGLVFDVWDLKKSFELDLSTLNSVLRSLGATFEPINNKDLHTAQFRAFLTNHNARIVERIRSTFVDQFDGLDDLSRYVHLRGAAEGIEPDSEWFERYDELPKEAMEQRIEIWLLAQGLSSPASDNDLPALSECRDKNGRVLREFSKSYAKVLSAWVRLANDEVTNSLKQLWSEPESANLGLIHHAHLGGWIEFRFLNDEQIARWLEKSGLWPPGKPVSASLTDWRLPEDTFTRTQAEADREREARRKARSEILFAGQRVSALESDYQALMDAVTTHLSQAGEFLDVDASFRSLLDIHDPPGRGGTGGGSGGRGRPAVDSSLSEDQKAAVGFIGERWAFEWIKALHQKRNNLALDDNCWVSWNRNIVFGGTAGRDDLGYDFEVRLSSTTYYYEVKASTGNPKFFEMGPTEIGAALKYKADRDNKYRILYIAYATDPHRVEATVLLNPFSRDGQKKFRAIGRGSVKYEFGVRDDN